ncbi:MAG: hydantoinase/oxoprolinase family protein [Gammaproteobacteria bacterium]
MAHEIIGWDIGGAHLKAAVLNARGELVKVLQHPCPLWQGLEKLQAAFDALLAELPVEPHLHALTMTGELVDLFSNREDGVKTIVATAAQLLGANKLHIFAAKQRFIKPEQLSTADIEAIASANWYASAAYAACKHRSALLIDIGSTTTDIILIEDATVRAVGMTDFERLASEELVYTGIVRTPVIAVTQKALFKGRHVGLMAEYFATMADVYRLTGELDEAYDQMPTADGAPKTVAASARRLCRMIGCDFEADELSLWKDFARSLHARQFQTIQNAVERQLSRTRASAITFVGAGIGRFLAARLARQWDYPYCDYAELFQSPADYSSMTASDCAPAAAVAALARVQYD